MDNKPVTKTTGNDFPACIPNKPFTAWNVFWVTQNAIVRNPHSNDDDDCDNIDYESKSDNNGDHDDNHYNDVMDDNGDDNNRR